VATDITHRAGLRVERRGPAAHVVLSRPERRNALSLALMREMTAALRDLAGDTDVRVVVVAGEGPAFSAGHDLSEMIGRNTAFYDELFEACTELMEQIHRLPQPVVARVHAIATAAGCQLVAACDLAIAAEEARFATPGVRIGLFCSTPMVPLTRAIGRKRALEMLLTGEPIDAQTALSWGLVNRVVPAAGLDAAVDALVERLAASSPHTLAIGKEAFYAQAELDEHDAYELTRSVMTANALAEDAQEGMGAFIEKRSPTWKGR
jgi:enoyl-CoA hydratase/carnithine racemase